MITVQPISSAISSIDFEKKTNEMTVHFQDGTKNTYLNVPEKVFREFALSGSVGGYFNANIRDVYKHK